MGPTVDLLPPKSIRTLGIVLACIGAFLLVSNLLSLFVIGVLDMPGRMARMIPPEQAPPFDITAMFDLMQPIAAYSAGAGLLLGIAGLYVRKYKRWALQLANLALGLLIIGLWYLPSYLAPLMRQMMRAMEEVPNNPFPLTRRFDDFFLLGQYFNALLWTAPIVVVLYLLNRKSSRIHFH